MNPLSAALKSYGYGTVLARDVFCQPEAEIWGRVFGFYNTEKDLIEAYAAAKPFMAQLVEALGQRAKPCVADAFKGPLFEATVMDRQGAKWLAWQKEGYTSKDADGADVAVSEAFRGHKALSNSAILRIVVRDTRYNEEQYAAYRTFIEDWVEEEVGGYVYWTRTNGFVHQASVYVPSTDAVFCVQITHPFADLSMRAFSQKKIHGREKDVDMWVDGIFPKMQELICDGLLW
jgi:hypothetical protein